MAKRPKAPSPLRERKRADRLARYQECHRLKRLGLWLRAIGRRLGLHRATVRNFLRHETFPERVEYPPRSQRTERYAAYLKQRLRDGCDNAAQLYREIKQQGYRGSSVTVRRLLRTWGQSLPARYQYLNKLPDFAPPAPRQAAWWLMKEQELEPQQQEYVRELLTLSPEISRGLKLVKEFQALLAGRKVNEFEPWRAAVERRGLRELGTFSNGLLKDEAAVRAAMTYDWSNRQVEGQVNKLKMIKRAMFGRASFDLLRARVLHAP